MDYAIKRLRPPFAVYPFTGAGGTDITVPHYKKGSCYVVVFGQKTRYPDVEFTEVRDSDKKYTIISPRNATIFPPGVACAFVYTPEL